MADFERISGTDSVRGITPEELSSLAAAIPGMLCLIPMVMNNPGLFHARMRCFLHRFCYGGFFRLTIGHLLQLWEQGYLRDEETFFYGGVGGFSGTSVFGVNTITGERCGIAGSFSDMHTATSKVWGIKKEERTVFQPQFTGDRASFEEFLETVNEALPAGSDCSLPEVRPVFVQRMEEKGITPVLPTMEFVTIPGGEFIMGKEENPNRITGDTSAGVPVEVDGFDFLTTPVTAEMWSTVAGQSHLAGDGAFILNNVNWHECSAFARILSSIDPEHDYRLPTEAEWEYSCRAGTTADCCLENESLKFNDEFSSGEPASFEVCRSKPNPWGLYDMGGAVYEWCADRFSPPCPDTAVSRQKAGFRVIRGGMSPFSRSYGQVPWLSGGHSLGAGFRLVRTLKKVSS